MTFGEVRGWGLGLLRMSREDFYNMRQGEFWEALWIYRKSVEADRRHLGELVRGATATLFNLQVQKKDRITDLRKFWPMPWDDEEDTNIEAERLAALSKEEQAAEAKAFLERINLKRKK